MKYKSAAPSLSALEEELQRIEEILLNDTSAPCETSHNYDCSRYPLREVCKREEELASLLGY